MAYCECGCGTEVKNRFVNGHYARLKNPFNDLEIKKRISDKCHERRDHSGEKYGKWTVVKYLYIKNQAKYYLCRCECGKEKIQRSGEFQHSMSCRKCSHRLHINWNRKEYGESSKNAKLQAYKKWAHKRKLEWNLIDKDAVNLMIGKCNYCGREPYRIFHIQHGHYGVFLYNGIDRINNKEGYNITNCCSCCPQCNRAKMDMTEKEFLNMINLIYNYRRKGNKKCPMVSDVPTLGFLKTEAVA